MTIVQLVKHFEAFHPEPYRDLVGVLTVGYGTTGAGVTESVRITEPLASQLLELRLQRDITTLERDLGSRKVSPHCLRAFGSLAYNVGVSGVLSYRAWMYLKRGDWLLAIPEYWDASRAGGKRVAGLVRRRNAELVYWLYGGQLEFHVPAQKALLKKYAQALVEAGHREQFSEFIEYCFS